MIFNKKAPKEPLQWKRGEKTPVNRFLSSVGIPCGLTEGDVFERRKKCHSINDTFWSLCNEQLIEKRSSDDWNAVQSIYLYMERLLASEGERPHRLTKERLKIQLLQRKNEEWNPGSVIPICVLDESCDSCRAIDGKEINIDKALSEELLPPKDCACAKCTISI